MMRIDGFNEKQKITIPIIFCVSCGSHFVDINGWTNNSAIFECSDCGSKSLVSGFTIGRTRNGTATQLEEAQKDKAKNKSKVR